MLLLSCLFHLAQDLSLIQRERGGEREGEREREGEIIHYLKERGGEFIHYWSEREKEGERERKRASKWTCVGFCTSRAHGCVLESSASYLCVSGRLSPRIIRF